ncbi:metal ABC transporter solute-binding protein, Zn/Mn family [Brumimicrobium oceani]|uniref:Manganese transporter n=1 Tax=Brumimicrobium oceani TaxID=2100725 RepID=A0A2U2XFQ1_9FLAO|nr:zinc ABC transporter substrate-binding protein [Brumimicrobium oceani]PWH86626.1 manganese transporter [Brumimicrobium oceani]
MKIISILVLLTLLLVSCNNNTDEGLPVKENKVFSIVTTTTMITDLVKNIGGDSVVVHGLMGAGVDPHLYKASEGDVNKLSNADMILYNGLHLEGKLVDVFERMEKQNINAIAVTDALSSKFLIGSELFESNYDPHIWFNIRYWELITLFVEKQLSDALPASSDYFKENAQAYLRQLKILQQEVADQIATLPEDKRRLVTAHDAFNYFGKAFGFDVVGLQGLSTATEAGVQDVQETAAYIIEHKVKAIFIESSVPRRTVEALQASVNSKDHDVVIGGTLYSDALGNPDTEEGTYIGMFRYNVKTIVDALK